MEKRRLGRTDLSVSKICLGTMTWGQQNTDQEGHEQMDVAFAHGVNFLDTAELYPIPPKPETQGRTEEIIGNWMKARGNRGDVILASKVVGRTANDWFRGGRPSKLVRADILDAIEKSLKRLQTDHIDLYQIHFPDRKMAWGGNPTRVRAWPAERASDETPIAETLGVFDELVKARAENSDVDWVLVNPVISAGPNKARVKVRIETAGNPPTNAESTIVFDDGRWKLSNETVCNLLGLYQVESAMCAPAS